MCKKKQEYSLLLQKSSKVFLLIQRESLEAMNCSKTLKSKEWMQDGKGERDEMEIK
jgi:hypothetical protein